MRSFAIIAFVATTAVLAAAHPSITQTDLDQQQQLSQLNEEGGRGWQSWNALRNWLRPATDYITQSLPDKTPTEVAQDVRDTAVDLRDRTKDHPVVQTVGTVVRPVHQWLSDAANSLRKTSFRQMYETALSGAQAVDRRVAQWLNNSRDGEPLQEYNVPQAENIEILH